MEIHLRHKIAAQLIRSIWYAFNVISFVHKEHNTANTHAIHERVYSPRPRRCTFSLAFACAFLFAFRISRIAYWRIALDAFNNTEAYLYLHSIDSLVRRTYSKVVTELRVMQLLVKIFPRSYCVVLCAQHTTEIPLLFFCAHADPEFEFTNEHCLYYNNSL